MNWLIDNWYVLLGVLVLAFVVVVGCIEFFGRPSKEQKEKVKEWLKWAVTEAERKLKGGTGALKLRMVYDMFVGKFPWVSRLLDFTTFSLWVDEALIWLNTQLSSNENVQKYVKEE